MTTDNPGQTGARGTAPRRPEPLGPRSDDPGQAQNGQAPDRQAPDRQARPSGPVGPRPPGARPAGSRPAGPGSPAGPAGPGTSVAPGGSGGAVTVPGTQRDARSTAGDRAQRREQARQARDEVAARTRAPRPRTRRAHLRASRLDPWSVMKVAFMLSIAVAIVGVIAVVVLWSALSAANVFDTINTTVRDQATFGTQAQQFDVLAYVGLNRVLGVSLLLAVVNVILGTALATLFSFVYNLTAGLLGGIEVTLAETE